MSFKSLSESKKQFTIVKQHEFNPAGFNSKFCVFDSGNITPFYFMCPKCKINSTSIKHELANSFNSNHIRIDLNSIIEHGGTGTISKLMICNNCVTHYFVGFGFMEPNNGREVIVLHSILELKEELKI